MLGSVENIFLILKRENKSDTDRKRKKEEREKRSLKIVAFSNDEKNMLGWQNEMHANDK